MNKALCDKLKKMPVFRDMIKKISAESKHDKIERSIDICEDHKKHLVFSEPRKGSEGCIGYCDTCPPGTKKITDVHTHPGGLVNPSVGDYIVAIKNEQRKFCIAGTDPYNNDILTLKCYLVPEELFEEKDSVKRHNKIADLVSSERSVCKIKYRNVYR